MTLAYQEIPNTGFRLNTEKVDSETTDLKQT